MPPLLKEYIIERLGQRLMLLPSKLVWAPDQATLFMADSHFGKASNFRKARLPVPSGTTAKMLDVLTQQIAMFQARTLIVLGDLLHSTVGAAEDFEQELFQWRTQLSDLQIVLIRGNHDRRAGSFYRELSIEFSLEESIRWNALELCHDPTKCTGQGFALCGHLHPAIQIASYKLPCFWLRSTQLVLPAFGEFTGTAKVQLTATEMAIAICEDSLAVVSNAQAPH